MTDERRPRTAAPACASEYRQLLVDGMAARDVEVHAAWARPLFPTGYEPLNMRCLHGVLWFMEPTAEQRAKYARESEHYR